MARARDSEVIAPSTNPYIVACSMLRLLHVARQSTLRRVRRTPMIDLAPCANPLTPDPANPAGTTYASNRRSDVGYH